MLVLDLFCFQSQRNISAFLDSPFGQSLSLDNRQKLLDLAQKFVDLSLEVEQVDTFLRSAVDNAA